MSDFSIIKHHFRDREDVKIYPIADVHLGAAEHMESQWNSFCRNIIKEDNAYIVLNGDLLNNCTRSSVSDIFEEKYTPSVSKRMMCEMLEPLRGRILAATCGNHERRSVKDVDDDPMADIMYRLRLEDVYRPNAAYIKVQIGDVSGNGKRNPTYCLVATHGCGGGGSVGAAANRAENFLMTMENVDCLIVGHTHKPFEFPVNRTRVDLLNNRITERQAHVVSASSWLGYGGYPMRGMMRPSAHAMQVITLDGHRKGISVSTSWKG